MIRTTLTLIGNRIATGADFLALGDGNHKSPDWRHLVVDWDGVDFFKSADIQLVDHAGLPYRNFNPTQLQAIAKFCRQYVNFYAADLAKV